MSAPGLTILGNFRLRKEGQLLCYAGLLILQPDVLLSGTRIAGSFKCPRLSVLEERFGGDSNAKAVEGTLLHDLLQVSCFCCAEELACED